MSAMLNRGSEREARAQLESLIPHRSPMLLLDSALAVDDSRALAAVTITEQSPFYRPERRAVPAWVGLEYMAQTIALWSGEQLRRADKAIRIGFLLGTRKYAAEVAWFAAGTRLEVEITAVFLEPGGLSSFDCEIRAQSEAGGAVLATARVNAFRPDDPIGYAREGIKQLTGEEY